MRLSTENHDYRRTSATLLKGDMNSANDVEKFAFVLKGSSNGQEQVVKPTVAYIDDNDLIDQTILVRKTDFDFNTYTKIFATNKISAFTIFKDNLNRGIYL